MKYGLIIPNIETREEGAQHLLGANEQIINPSANWEDSLPTGELQNKGLFEPSACASFGTNHAVATSIIFQAKTFVNYSDRALAIGSGTDPSVGNDPHKVAEYARNTLGFADESVLPYDDSVTTLEKFYSPNPLTQDIISKGYNDFYGKFDFTHKWVFQGGVPEVKKQLLKEALKRGTVCVSVHAWVKDGDVYVKPQGTTDNHWVQLVKYDEQDKPVIFDSYAEADSTPYLKTLESNYDFAIAKVYFVSLTARGEKLSWFKAILEGMKKLLVDFLSYRDNEVNHTPVDAPIVSPINVEPPAPAQPVVPKVSKLDLFCKAIEKMENANQYLNNPGNIKYNDFTRDDLKATGASPAGYATWKTYEDGYNALKQLVLWSAQDKIKYRHNCTILSFFQGELQPNGEYLGGYAPTKDHNDPIGYANFVASKVGESVTAKLKDFIF